MLSKRRVTPEALFIIPIILILLPASIPVEFKDNPHAVIIRKCLGLLETSDSSHVTIDGSYYEKSDEKISFHFDGVIDFPGDIDGTLKIVGSKVIKDGRIIMLNGRTFYQKANTNKWSELEQNSFNQYENNPLFRCIKLILNLTYHPEYFKSRIEHSDVTINDKKADYIKLTIDLTKLRADKGKSNQPEALKHFIDNLTGKTATAEIWIEKKTGFLLKLAIEVDGWGKSKMPLNGTAIFKDYNEPIKIERPKQVEPSE